MSDEFSESIRQRVFSPLVVSSKRYLRKYWSSRKESITVKCKTTEAQTPRQNFKNEIRGFLYTIPGGQDDFQDLITEYFEMGIEMAREVLTEQISVKIRAYEKELFYIKCLKLSLKPQLVLRALAYYARERRLDKVFTAPEYLFALISVMELEKPVFSKNIKGGKKT